MKKIKSKLFTASISTLAVMPLLCSCVPTNIVKANSSNTLYSPIDANGENIDEACTVTYIGKDCTPNKTPIAARATDCPPKAVHLKLKHFRENELANKTIVGKLGMSYTFGNKTIAYTSCPLSDKTASDPTWATGMWENNGINEMGVGVSATLTCKTNPKIAVKEQAEGECIETERFIDRGAGEELLPTIMAAQATSAKHAMQLAAEAIKKADGAQDANIIFACDQNEAWLMEIYSRHQYCAVKLPDDKVFIAGNEFILDSLADLGITKGHNEENCIISDGLLSVPQAAGYAQFIPGATEKDVYHLDLFNTYAYEGTDANGGVNKFRDTCHMRTWRGYSLFDKSPNPQNPTYSDSTKYKPFLTPKDANGNARTDMSYADVIKVYRDQFDELTDPSLPTAQQPFVDAKTKNTLRCIAVETTRAIHIMSSDPSKPKWIAANQWYTPSSGNYTPFLLINNAMQSIDGEFGYYPDRFEYTEECSSVLYRALNKLAWYDRVNYGYPLQQFWTVFENIYSTQMQQVIDEASKLTKIADAKNIVTNFNKYIRDIYISQIKKTKNDLMWHIMDQPTAGKELFVPLIDLQQYVTDLGWTDYKFDGTKATFKRDSFQATYTVSDGAVYSKGTFDLGDGTTLQLSDSVVDGKVYVDMNTLNTVFLTKSEVRHININDYLVKINHAVWAAPLAVLLAGSIAVGIYFGVKRKKAKRIASATQTNI